MNGGEESASEFIVSGGDCTESLEFTEETFDEVAFAIEGEVSFALDEPVGFGWNDGGNPPFFQSLDQGVRVVGLVCEKGFRLDVFEQGCRLSQIRILAGRERYGDRVAERVHDNVDFGCQTASGSSDGLACAVFFRAPALC